MIRLYDSNKLKIKMYYLLLVLLVCLSKISVCAVAENNIETTGFFWHVTDIHVDQNYSRTGNPHDLCHEANVLYPDNGLFGNFLCDSPQYLVNVTFKAMQKIKANPDFIIWTGDNLPHTVNTDWTVIFEALHNVTALFDEYFPNIPVFPCIGNHDTFPPNMLIPNETSNPIYEDILVKGGWDKYLNHESASTFIKGGYFSQNVQPGLRIISLNTILWYAPNHFTEKMSDPTNQFKWFEEILSNCSKTSEKVYIIGHVPPGFYNRVKYDEKSSPTYHPQYLDAYLKILKKYSAIIIGQIFGHLHMDMFQLFQLESGHFVSSSVLGSSVTPWYSARMDNVSIPVNPSVRLMHYDRTSGLLKDYEQFYLNLTEANNMTETEVSNTSYELLYTFTKAYNVPDVSTESLIEVYEKIKSNDTLFEKFFKFSTAGKQSVLCDEFCKIAQLCSISSTSMDEYNMCMRKIDDSNVCQDSVQYVNYSNLFAYGIATVISCISIFLLFFVCHKYKRSDNEMFTKLLREF